MLRRLCVDASLGSTSGVACVLQQFPGDESVAMYRVKVASALGKLDGYSSFGYTLRDRLGCFEVPIEEFYEAHVPAKSSQKSQNARFSQTHEHGRWTQGHRGPPPAGP